MNLQKSESYTLALQNSTIPIKALPKEKLNYFIYDVFCVWLSDLLSLTDEISAKRLEISLPAIEEHCWSMGFAEIKKMFEMYADNKLSIKPIPNYFDRILFGKIVEAYKAQKPNPKTEIKPKEISEEEKKKIISKGIEELYLCHNLTGQILSGKTWIYHHFYELGVFPNHTKEFRVQIIERAKKELETEYKKSNNRNMPIDLFKKQIQKDGSLNVKCKEIILRDWLDNVDDIKKYIE